GYTNKLFIFSNKVCFAVQHNHCRKLIVFGTGNNNTFISITVTSILGNFLTFLTKNLNCFIKITFCLNQGFLAVHHACTGLLSKLIYFSSSYVCHCCIFLLNVNIIILSLL